MSVRSRVVLALAVGVSVLVGVGLLNRATSGRGHGEPVVVLDVPEGRVAGGVAVDDSVVVVLTEETGEFEGRTILVRLDAATGVERQRIELIDWSAFDEVVVWDGNLVLRLRGRLPGVPATEVSWPAPPSLAGEFWLAVIDGTTLAPVHQYQLPHFDLGARNGGGAHEPLLVIDGTYWLLGGGLARGRIDLRTGERLFEDSFERRLVRGVAVDGDRLAVATLGRVTIHDRDTGAKILHYLRTDLEEIDGTEPIFFWPHEGKIWIDHVDLELDGLPRRLQFTGALDPNRPRTVEDRPSTPIPAWVFESGGHRWELLRDHAVVVHNGVSPPPEPDDRWRQVDPATDEVVDVLRLGAWQLRFATPDHLWVTRERADGVGRELARLALAGSDDEG